MNKTQNLLNAVKEGMIEKKAKNIVIIKFPDSKSAITDYFMICEASTDQQVTAVSASI